MQGETVTVTYDAARWIQALILGEPSLTAAPTAYPTDALDLLADDLERSPDERARFQPDVNLPDECTIYLDTHRVALQAAATYLAGREQATSERVLQVADQFAEWLLGYPSV